LAGQFPYTFQLTRAGRRLLEASDDHPLLPRFVERLATRCPGLPDDAISLLSDAIECLDRGLLRPAVVLMGVAYEVAVEQVVVTQFNAGAQLTAPSETSAAKRIAEIRRVIIGPLPEKTGPQKERKGALVAAYDFADHLRRRRNDGAHTTPRHGLEDRAEIEEFLISAGRHIPTVWSLRIP